MMATVCTTDYRKHLFVVLVESGPVQGELIHQLFMLGCGICVWIPIGRLIRPDDIGNGAIVVPID